MSKCGYWNCSCKGIRFISRYREHTDYCVDGERLTVGDCGCIHMGGRRPEREIVERFKTHMLDAYANYLTWRSTCAGMKGQEYQPFDVNLWMRL